MHQGSIKASKKQNCPAASSSSSSCSFLTTTTTMLQTTQRFLAMPQTLRPMQHIGALKKDAPPRSSRFSTETRAFHISSKSDMALRMYFPSCNVAHSDSELCSTIDSSVRVKVTAYEQGTHFLSASKHLFPHSRAYHQEPLSPRHYYGPVNMLLLNAFAPE